MEDQEKLIELYEAVLDSNKVVIAALKKEIESWKELDKINSELIQLLKTQIKLK